MLFNSLNFLLFFSLVTTLYFVVPHRFRWMLLLAASCYFYMAFIPVYILILLITIVIDYTAGRYIESADGKRRRLGLLAGILSTCLTLFVFKYYDFVATNMNAIGRTFGAPWAVRPLGLILPIGLSFHTFQSLSYVIEVYRGRQRAERHFGIYSLYVMFYPQLVAGPIERPQNLLHQFREEHRFEYDNARDGLRLMLWGMFKKVVVADRLAIYVDAVYRHLPQHSGITIVVATVAFAFQIYCDFSGYSDIAVGTARVMGFNLMQNFNHPYFASSVADFWRRWHISLSTWFRDYVYVPLGGNRVGRGRWYGNILTTFLVSGLWHGANWTYVVWGGLNGFYQVVSATTRPWRDRLGLGPVVLLWPRVRHLLAVAMTFTLICSTWVFFRTATIGDAFIAFGKILHDRGPLFMAETSAMIYGIAGVGVVLAVDLSTRGRRFERALSDWSVAARWSLYFVLIISILAAGVFNESQFIYFQF